MYKKNQGKKAVLYARKSTEDSGKQVQSIDDQIRIMKEIAENEGLRIVEVVSEAKSAKAPKVRVKFEKMMSNIADGKYDIILAWDTSRLSRNPVDSGTLEYMLNEGVIAGIRTHEKWYYESDDLLLSIEGSMNSRFIKELSSKVTRGMTSKADKGDYPSMAPVGYINDRLNKIIIKDPIMFDKVAELWRKALTGTYTVSGLTRIADKELTIRTPQTKKEVERHFATMPYVICYRILFMSVNLDGVAEYIMETTPLWFLNRNLNLCKKFLIRSIVLGQKLSHISFF